MQEVGSVPILHSHEKAGADADKKDDVGATTSRTAEEEDAKADDTFDNTSDAPAPDKYLYTEVVKRPSSSTLEQVGEEEEAQEEEDLSQEAEEGDKEIPRFTDNLAVYNSNKNTTDSGFYSVKEANSDSESGSEMKTDDVSPTQESSSATTQEGATLPKCNHSERGISDSAAVSGERLASEEGEEEEESVLERTMTSDDFKESLESGHDKVCADNVETKSQNASVASVGCENGANEVGANAEKDVFVQDSPKDKDSDSVAMPTENHVHAETVDSPTANGEDVQQRDKTKKKKKKAKNKKNKQKHQEQESENHTNDSVNAISSNSKSQKSKLDNDNPELSGIPVSSSTSIEHTSALASSASLTRKTSLVEDMQSDNAGSEPTTAASPDVGGKPTTSVSAMACSRLVGEGSGSRDDRDVYARVEAVKSKRNNATTTERCGKINKGSLHLNLESAGSNRNMLAENEQGLDDASKSRENELLDSWGLSSILTRILTPEDSGVVEGGDSDMRSSRDVSDDMSQRQLTGDLPGSALLKTISESVDDQEGFSSVGGSSQSNLRSSGPNGDMFWVIVFLLYFPNHSLCTVGSF